MPTFPKGFANYRVHVKNAQLLERVAREAGGDVAKERSAGYAHTAADALSLRGIPAVGRSVSGVILGTQPEREVVVRLTAYDRIRLRFGLIDRQTDTLR